MTRQKSRALNVLAAAAALACIGNAFAQSNETYNPNAYILLNGSAVKPDSKYPEDKTGFGGGLKYGMPLDPSWDLQIGGNYAASKDHGDNFHQALAGVDALYLFAPGGFRPFVLFGGGVAHDHFGGGNVPPTGTFKRTAPYLNAGLGFQYKFTPTLGMQADVREVGTFYRTRVPAPMDAKHTMNTYANVGLTWAFGAPAAPAPAPIVAPAPAPAPAPVMAPPPPPPAPVPPPPPAPVLKKFTLSAGELFGFNSAKLGPNQPKLDEVAATMKANPDIASVTIVGYTDRLGSKAYNQKLSEQRANAVKAYLESKGVAGNRLTAVGKGEADPVAECKTEKKHADLVKCLEPNRRVEIEPVTYTKQVN